MRTQIRHPRLGIGVLGLLLAGAALFGCQDQPITMPDMRAPPEQAAFTQAPQGRGVEVFVTPGQEIYRVGQTARFDVAVFKEGEPLADASAVVTATYPTEASLVSLTSTGPGAYAFEALLPEPGQVTLAVTVRHHYGNAIEVLQAQIARLEQEIEDLRAQLPGADPREAERIQARIDNRLDMIERIRARIANMQEPEAYAASTVTVLPAGEPPIFGLRWPARNNAGTWTNNPLHRIAAEVLDVDGDLATVELWVDGVCLGLMRYDGLIAEHLPSSPWSEDLHHVRIRATDQAGNAAELTFEFLLDLVPPVFLPYPPDSLLYRKIYLENQVLLEVTMYDAGGIKPGSLRAFEFPDGIPIFPLTVSLTDNHHLVAVYDLTDMGRFARIYVNVRDWAGNMTEFTYINFSY
jgi:hypothetical protein